MRDTVLDPGDKNSPGFCSPRKHSLVRGIQGNSFSPWRKPSIGVNPEKNIAGPLNLGLGSQGKLPVRGNT